MHRQASSSSAMSKGRPLPPGSWWGLGCTEGREVSGSTRALQALYKKVVSQFVFKTHQPTGKVCPQCQLGPTGGISWHQPARSTSELQEGLEQPDAATQKPMKGPGSEQSDRTAAEGALGPAVMLLCCPTRVHGSHPGCCPASHSPSAELDSCCDSKKPQQDTSCLNVGRGNSLPICLPPALRISSQTLPMRKGSLPSDPDRGAQPGQRSRLSTQQRAGEKK